MAELISSITPAVTEVFTVVGQVATTIVETPLLLLTTGFLVVGGAISIFGRMLSKN